MSEVVVVSEGEHEPEDHKDEQVEHLAEAVEDLVEKVEGAQEERKEEEDARVDEHIDHVEDRVDEAERVAHEAREVADEASWAAAVHEHDVRDQVLEVLEEVFAEAALEIEEEESEPEDVVIEPDVTSEEIKNASKPWWRSIL